MVNKPVIAIIQARMSSTRLPGKVLLPLSGKPVIRHIVDRALQCENVDSVVVATSNEPSDDPLFDYCSKNNINVYRGSLNNVLGRFTSILKTYPYDYCVRITGDCPLIHPHFIDTQIKALNAFDGDVIWTPKQSSVLEGQGVMSARALRTVEHKSSDPEDLEHVGSKYLIAHANEFKFVGLDIPEVYYSYDYHLALDEVEDYELLKVIFEQKWEAVTPSLEQVLTFLDGLKAEYIQNRAVQDSKINQLVNAQKKVFRPDLVGSYEWSRK